MGAQYSLVKNVWRYIIHYAFRDTGFTEGVQYSLVNNVLFTGYVIHCDTGFLFVCLFVYVFVLLCFCFCFSVHAAMDFVPCATSP